MTELVENDRKTECPGCESMQTFPLRYEDEPRLEGVQRVFLRCTSCPWHHFIGFTTISIENYRKIVGRLAARAISEEKRHGEVSNRTEFNLATARKVRNTMRAELQRRVQESGIDEREFGTATAH